MLRPVPGMVLADRYRLNGLLGSGGMGSVWRSEDLVLGRLVAVKLLAESSVAQPGARERFRREARSVARLSHPRIAGVYDYYETVDGAFIVMELIEGETLGERLARVGRLPATGPDGAAEIAAQTAEALHAAHSAGILHRDIKPGNIMLTEQGVKVVDFGIATTAWDSALTATHSVVGTASYLAPERGMGAPSTPAADLYALGVVLYEMLTGRAPFQSDNPVAILHAHATAAPPPLPFDVPPPLADVCLRLLAKDPAARPAPAAAVAASLRGPATAALAQRAAMPPPPVAGTYPGTLLMSTPRPPRPPAPARPEPPVRHDRRALGFAAIAVVAVAAIAVWLISSQHPRATASSSSTTGTSATTSTFDVPTAASETTTMTSTTTTITDSPTETPADAQTALSNVSSVIRTGVSGGSVSTGEAAYLDGQLVQVRNRLDQNHPEEARHTVSVMIAEVQARVRGGYMSSAEGQQIISSLENLRSLIPGD